MTQLTYIEKNTIEKFLEMKSGYVMNFSDRTFREFINDATGLDIDDTKYQFASNSKAKKSERLDIFVS